MFSPTFSPALKTGLFLLLLGIPLAITQSAGSAQSQMRVQAGGSSALVSFVSPKPAATAAIYSEASASVFPKLVAAEFTQPRPAKPKYYTQLDQTIGEAHDRTTVDQDGHVTAVTVSLQGPFSVTALLSQIQFSGYTHFESTVTEKTSVGVWSAPGIFVGSTTFTQTLSGGEYTTQMLLDRADNASYPFSGNADTSFKFARRTLSPSEEELQVTKLKYKIKVVDGFSGPVEWQEIFVPDDPTQAAETLNLSETVLLGARETTVHMIDPLRRDAADTNLAHRHPDQNGNYYVAMLQMGVDANRDGQIAFGSSSADQTSAIKPYQFWINDDVDRHARVDTTAGFGGFDVQDDLEADLHPGNLDCDLDTIPGTRDLEDWTRLWIGMGGLQESILSGKMAIGLKWVGNFSAGNSPAIKLLQAEAPDGEASYLTDTPTAEAQIAGVYANAVVNAAGTNTLIKPTTAAYDFVIPVTALGNLSADNPIAHFLFEGCQRGQGQLTMVLLQNNNGTYTKMADGPGVYLDLKNIKEMYERWTVGEGNGGEPEPIKIADTRRPSDVTPLEYTFPLQSQEQNAYILYVHGWNMAPWEKDAFAETAFKRLYWQGYKGRFGAFQWPTTHGDTLDAIRGSYDKGEYTAWRSASPLADKLVILSPRYNGNLYVVAHSMGNVVTGEALRLAAQRGATSVVNTYIASQAAVPGEAWDAGMATAARLPYFAGRGPNTPDIYGDWMLLDHGTAVATRVNFFNTRDYALNIWRTNATLKPDWYLPTAYYYASGNITNPQDLFKTATAVSLADAELIVKTHSGLVNSPLSLGDRTNAPTTDRYKIMAYAAEPRSLPLGAISQAINGFTSVNLGPDPSGVKNRSRIWPADTLSNNKYSAHPWHSAQFRFTNMDQAAYWKELLGRNGFDLTSP